MDGKIPTQPLLVSDDKPIPLLGLGTAEFPLGSSPHAQEAVVHAIGLGYRHFDTASIYHSENQLGKAVAEAVHLGIIKSRDELFITSKLWISDAHGDCVLPALRKSLENLGVDYLDLYLIHWPVSLAQGPVWFPFCKKDIIPLDIKAVWEAMEECHRLGLARNIGVSNFSSVKLEQLLRTAKIPPAVNQVELNPFGSKNS
ncbi:hypothetical protein MLD38_011337 [Melastoma candidum]|uniref:Uncharacterized protein n=1 Tax=Melastoma candidum TaxID=119954 RepID=A0ACB9R2R5_9MYRT|nr:hypothetical protein MLD38_011337 [Melastoma candidum]